MYLFEYRNMTIDEKRLIKNKGEMKMRTIRTIAYISVALLIVSMLAIGAVSAKAGDGNGGKMANNGNCIGDCDRDRVCDGECINTGVCEPKAHNYEHNYDYCNSES